METACNACRALLGYAERMLADIPDEDFAKQPAPGVHHPAWIMGHLTVVADAAMRMAGSAGGAPEGWAALFGPRSECRGERALYPSKAELVEAFRKGHADACAAAATASPELLAERQMSPAFRKELPTKRDMLAFLLIGHLGVHLGQLSMWRRLDGRPPLF